MIKECDHGISLKEPCEKCYSSIIYELRSDEKLIMGFNGDKK